eukprot:459769-Hanusia_phi.AAC.1
MECYGHGCGTRLSLRAGPGDLPVVGRPGPAYNCQSSGARTVTVTHSVTVASHTKPSQVRILTARQNPCCQALAFQLTVLSLNHCAGQLLDFRAFAQ